LPKATVAEDEAWMKRLNVQGVRGQMPVEPDEPVPIIFFFPEIIGVAVSVILSPLWCARLVSQGYVVYGCLILSIAIMGALGFVWCMIKRRRFVAWMVMLAILLAFLLIFSRLPPTVSLTIGLETRIIA
jgi:hypothetical protein